MSVTKELLPPCVFLTDTEYRVNADGSVEPVKIGANLMTDLQQRMGGELRAGRIDSGQGSIVYVKTDSDILASGSHKDLSLERARILAAGGNLIGDVEEIDALAILKRADEHLQGAGQNMVAMRIDDLRDLIERRIREARGEGEA